MAPIRPKSGDNVTHQGLRWYWRNKEWAAHATIVDNLIWSLDSQNFLEVINHLRKIATEQGCPAEQLWIQVDDVWEPYEEYSTRVLRVIREVVADEAQHKELTAVWKAEQQERAHATEKNREKEIAAFFAKYPDLKPNHNPDK